VTGVLTFEQKASGGPTSVTGTLKAPAGKLSLRVHQFGDILQGCESTLGYHDDEERGEMR
jgi:hypothetical protein